MLPEHAPFTSDQKQNLQTLLSGLSLTQRTWLAGYLSAESSALPTQTPSQAHSKLTILYGSESGNSEKLASLSLKEAQKRGFKTTLKNMADISPAELSKIDNLLVIVSTWGDGDAPETAATFHKQLMTTNLELPKLRYSVCALGDTAYAKFCQVGKDVDARLESFGAQRVSPRQDCDLEYEAPHLAWLNAALLSLTPAHSASATTSSIPTTPPLIDSGYGKKKPFPSELLEKVLLNGKGSAKETWHYEFSLENSGLSYEPGDALAVVPLNAPDLVQGILKAAKLSGTEEVDVKDQGKKILADALREDFEITALSRPLLLKLHALTNHQSLANLLADEAKDQLKTYLWGRWIMDALIDFAPSGLQASELTSLFRKLPPRLYSIASSPLAHPDEVHLTVASVRYQAHGHPRKGVASTYLADLVQSGDKVSVYTHSNKNFRLPASAETPIIMVGPGTGVAPFRAFIEHRAAQGNAGRSWLFFGDQRYTYDFLYQVEWQDHLKSGALTHLDVAFSRDQPEKIYVQDRLSERSKELYAWLQEGAHFYVCGDASRMAHDVHQALISLVEKEGGKSRETAEAYVEELKKTKRYQRDVY
jgi:sulfite reductase (NADPH) flavoprotein alpha-component